MAQRRVAGEGGRRRRVCQAPLPRRDRKGKPPAPQSSSYRRTDGVRRCLQDRLVKTTAKAIEESRGVDLPPLRNPPLLEATEDLTNLSYLNEPAGAPESACT